MSTKYQIKAPDGRIVQAPRSVIVSQTDASGNLEVFIDKNKLKPGWSIATADDLAAAAKKGA